MPHKRFEHFRRSPHLVGYWQEGSLAVRNYETGITVLVPPLAVELLDLFDDWQPASAAAASLGVSVTDVKQALDDLENASLLQRSRGGTTRRASAMDMWKPWNPAAGFFHMSTRDVRFLDPIEISKTLRRKAGTTPPPAPVKRYPGARRYQLPRVRSDGEFARVLLERRTWRQFAKQAVPLDDLATLLGLTGGIQKWVSLPGQGDLALKTSPSGGARHPIELYVCARRVDGLPPGLYHYDGSRHRLNLLTRHSRRVRVQRYLPTQFWYEGAAVLVFFSAVTARYLWKYTYARAYRALLIEAGHQCQTFCLVATSLGLAPFCSMALADSRIEQDLGLDGVSESVLYAAGVGPRPRGMASASRPAGFRRLEMRLNTRVLQRQPR